MKIRIENINGSLFFCLNLLRWMGFLVPDELTKKQRVLCSFYAGFWTTFLVGIYITVQTSELIHVWGDLPLMTETSFLLLTNLVLFTKIITVIGRRHAIQVIIDEADVELSSEDREEGAAIVKRCNRETSLHLILYYILAAITTLGWASSAEKGQLPLRAWYPYDTTRSPAYELTYAHQASALFLSAGINVAMDTLVASLIAQCRCRLNLLGLSLKTLCEDLDVDTKQTLTPEQEEIVSARLRQCVLQHQRALDAAVQLQNCFSEPTFAQFTVSLLIICVTAFQLVSQTTNMVRLLSMGAYLLCMIFQVFIYCYQGNQLSEESSCIADAAYMCPWYLFPLRVRRALLVLMVRAHRVAKLTAGGFTTLSLASFMAIIKASYSLFTLLQQVEEKK